MVLNALRAAPSIENISLHGYLHVPTPQQTSFISPVPLRELRFLRLVDSIEAITDVLDIIRIPRASSISIDIDASILTIEQMTRPFSSIKVSWPIHLSAVRSFSAAENGSALSFWLRTEFTPSEGPPSNSEPGCLGISLPPRSASGMSAIATLITVIESYEMINLRSFRIDTIQPSEAMKGLIHALSRLPMLEKVSLEGCEDSLRRLVDALDGYLYGSTPFPRLSEIECRRMVLEQGGRAASILSFTRIMQKALPAPPIKVIRMHRCRLSHELLLQLRATLPRLDILWDGD